MSLLKAAKRNALANYVNFAVVAIVTIIVSPILVAYLGVAPFGIWKTIQKYLAFGTVADGRATQALKWVVARGVKTADARENRQSVGSAVSVWILFLPLTGLFAMLLVWGLPHLINDISTARISTVRLVGGLLALNLVVTPLLGIPDAVLVGGNRGYASMLVKTGMFIVNNGAMVAVAYAGYGLTGIAIAFVGCAALTAVIVFYQAKRLTPWFGIAKPSFKQVRGFFGFSGWIMLWSIIAKLLLSSDLLLIGYMIGPSAVTNYVFTSYAPQLTLSVCLMTAGAAMPGIGSQMVPGNEAQTRLTMNSLREVVTFIGLAACVGIVLFNHLFVALWAGENRYMGGLVNALIVLEVFQLTLFRVEGQIQDLSLDIRNKVLIGLASTVLALGLAFLFYHFVGKLWAIFAGIIAGRMVMSVIFPVIVNRMAKLGSTIFIKQVMAVIIIACCVIIEGVFYGESIGTIVFTEKLGIFIVIVTSAFFLILGKQSRKRLISMLPRHFRIGTVSRFYNVKHK